MGRLEAGIMMRDGEELSLGKTRSSKQNKTKLKTFLLLRVFLQRVIAGINSERMNLSFYDFTGNIICFLMIQSITLLLK